MRSQINYIQSSADQSCKIAVRSCLPESEIKSIILILHGATLPSIIFDLPVSNGQSMMSYMASHGIAAYSLDYRGYGLSLKPLAMDDPLMEGSPLINHADAAADVMDVLNFIRKRHARNFVIFCGFSWGSTIAGHIAATTNIVERLILLGPVYSYKNSQWAELADPSDTRKLNPVIKSYRIAGRDRWCSLWDRELKEINGIHYRDPEVLAKLLLHIETSDKDWAYRSNREGCIRIPTGVLSDALRVYNQDPIYDASKIKCPTLVIRGENDTASVNADVLGIINALTCNKERIDIADATHYGILERTSERFFEKIKQFILA